VTIRAVFFDVDDTLVDYETAAYRSFRAALGDDADYDVWRGLEHYERFMSGELGFQEMRHLRMADYLVAIGRSADVPRAVEIERVRFDGVMEHCALFDDALPCLQRLRDRGLLLGLITNNESVHQRAKITAVGLDGLFDVVVISGEFGVAKPDPRIFAHACELLGVRPEEALHVGDNLTADARGAMAAGMRAVWLDRLRGDRPADLEVIGGLAEVHALL
jgi:putative hydrolase of the HAD superfamily